MKKKIKKNYAVITGSGGGIGKSLIKNLIKSFNLVIFTNTFNKKFNVYVENQKKIHNAKIKLIRYDFTKVEGLQKILEKKFKSIDNIEILINNAGVLQNSSFFTTSYKDVIKSMNINFISHFIITQFIVKKMIKNKNGKIFNIVTNSIFLNPKGRIAYNSSKSALDSFTKTLAIELAPFNIVVNSISPGLTNTKMMRLNTSKRIINEMKKYLPKNKIATPDQISKFIFFLINNNCGFLTGQNIRVDGGVN